MNDHVKITIAEATTVFGDPLSVTTHDPDHSMDEDRYITIGTTDRERLVIIAHAERGDRIRIISARELTRSERRDYEETNKE